MSDNIQSELRALAEEIEAGDYNPSGDHVWEADRLLWRIYQAGDMPSDPAMSYALQQRARGENHYKGCRFAECLVIFWAPIMLPGIVDSDSVGLNRSSIAGLLRHFADRDPQQNSTPGDWSRTFDSWADIARALGKDYAKPAHRLRQMFPTVDDSPTGRSLRVLLDDCCFGEGEKKKLRPL